MDIERKCLNVKCEIELINKRSNTKYCCKKCKDLQNGINRYALDEDLRARKTEAANLSYANNKKVSYKTLDELTEDDLIKLKEVKPEWF